MSELTKNQYDPLLQVQKDAYRCGKCMLCKWIDHEEMTDTEFMTICPSGARYKYEAYFASGRQEIARGLLRGRRSSTTTRLLHVLFTCTECGGCQVICSEPGQQEPAEDHRGPARAAPSATSSRRCPSTRRSSSPSRTTTTPGSSRAPAATPG